VLETATAPTAFTPTQCSSEQHDNPTSPTKWYPTNQPNQLSSTHTVDALVALLARHTHQIQHYRQHHDYTTSPKTRQPLQNHTSTNTNSVTTDKLHQSTLTGPNRSGPADISKALLLSEDKLRGEKPLGESLLPLKLSVTGPVPFPATIQTPMPGTMPNTEQNLSPTSRTDHSLPTFIFYLKIR
jgi:hypothetical protein